MTSMYFVIINMALGKIVPLASRLSICVIKCLLLLIEENMLLEYFQIFRKAFDTVNHVILFDKLEHYGIRGLALEWVKSYFSQRKQFDEFNNVISSPEGISCGVPQGSILDPLFFILYVNDLNNASMLDAILFADDTNLFISHNDPVYLINTLNTELDKLSTWFTPNRLSLNLSKTNFIVFKPWQKKQSFEFQGSINEQPILRVSETMFLGVFQMII